MPKKIHNKLKRAAKKRGLTGDRANAYVFGPRTNCTGQDVKNESDPKMYDYLVCYLHHHHATYVLPASAAKTKNLTFYPDGLTNHVNANYENYRDAWHLLRTGG
jgi:hypothetical protein